MQYRWQTGWKLYCCAFLKGVCYLIDMTPIDFGQAFVEGIESENGADPLVKWAHIDIAGTMDVGHLSSF